MAFQYTVKARETDRRVLNLAWPCVMENIFAMAVGFIDAAMIGSLGAHSTAAVGAVGPFTWLLAGLVQSLGVGGTAVVARLIGAGEKEEAERVTGQAFWMSAAVSAFMMVFVLLFASWIPVMMQADPSLHKDAALYLRCLAVGFIPNYTGLAMGGILRGAGDTKTPMVSGLIANILNIILNFFLIYETRVISVFSFSFTVWGAGWGVAGAALASAAATGAAGVFILLGMLKKRAALHIKPEYLKKIEWQAWKRIMHVGTPAALERAVVNLGQIAFTGMVSAMGVVEIAAHTLAIQIEGLGYMPAFGFAAAATALVGQNLGAVKPEEARYSGKRSVLLCTGVLTVVGVLTFIFADWLIALFTPDPDVRRVGAMLVRICSFEQPFNAMMNVYSGALRGAGDTRRPLVYSFVSMWLIRIAMAWFFGVHLSLGVSAIWWCMVADLGMRSLLLGIRFHRGNWTTIRV